MNTENKTHSGFVAIVGPTNAGKSTLINTIMGRKVAAVSHKVQTTRTGLRAVKMVGDTQLVFVDTPGIFRPKRRLDRAMVDVAINSFANADAVLLVLDAKHGITETIKNIVRDLPKNTPLFAFLNKADAVKKETLLPMIAGLSELADFRDIFMGSALKNDGVEPMLLGIAAVIPENPYFYDATDSVDVPDFLWLAEITREKIYKFVHQELPYQIYVETEKVETDADGVLEIYQKIAVASESHKKIVVGRAGEMLGRIGTAARHEIQDEWGVNARLHLFVRVETDWENRTESYNVQNLEM
ncbi:MAG: GTPase Era [Rickettsiales bacterium]|jgi:GTP-binding protein Era|nr:GTPase Era [Rickettsiales bacterium]